MDVDTSPPYNTTISKSKLSCEEKSIPKLKWAYYLNVSWKGLGIKSVTFLQLESPNPCLPPGLVQIPRNRQKMIDDNFLYAADLNQL